MPDAAGNLLRIEDLDSAELERLLDLAMRMSRTSSSWVIQFRGQALACFFDDPHAEARIPAEVAATRLGLVPLVLRSRDLACGPRPAGEVAHSLSAQVVAILSHAVRHELLEEMAAAARVPVVNAGSDTHDPCQAVADLLTLRQCFGRLRGLRIAYIGPAGPTAHSLMEAAALAGIELRLACPAGTAPDPAVEASARRMAEASGARIDVGDDPRAALATTDAVYAGARPAEGRGDEPVRVDDELMRLLAPGALLMRSDPAASSLEADSEMQGGRRSAAGRQAANRIPALQAILCERISANRSQLRGHQGRGARPAARHDDHRPGGGAHQTGRGAAEQGAPNRSVSA